MFGGFFMKKFISGKSKAFDSKLMKSIVFGVLCSIATVTILTVIFSFVLTLTNKYPTDAINYISSAFLGIGGLVGGYIAGRINQKAGLAVGALSGFIVFVIIFIVGLSQSVGTITILTLIKLIVLLIFGGLGGVLGVNKKKNIKI